MKQKVLVVDDDPDVREILSVLLRKVCDVLKASNGKGALRVIEERHPTILLLDLSMPGMDGMEVLKAARTADPGITVIMISGEKNIDIAKKALDVGADEFITKPFNVDYLRSEVERLVSRPNKNNEKDPAYRPWRVVS